VPARRRFGRSIDTQGTAAPRIYRRNAKTFIKPEMHQKLLLARDSRRRGIGRLRSLTEACGSQHQGRPEERYDSHSNLLSQPYHFSARRKRQVSVRQNPPGCGILKRGASMNVDPVAVRNAARHSGYLKAVLTAIAVLLGILVLRPATDPPHVQAQSEYDYLYIEPGTTMLRKTDGSGQVLGKVVIDRRTGDVWGFPTSTNAPYPVVVTSHEPPVSKPMYLGKFDFAAIKR
jgi:hypothetical protein